MSTSDSVCACFFFPQRMGVLNVGQRIEEQAEFEKIYKNGNDFVLCSWVAVSM